MATTLRETGASLLVLTTLLGLGTAWQAACAQTLKPTVTPATPLAPSAEPVQTMQIQPMVDVMVTATSNGYIGTNNSDTPRKDLILKTTAGADVNIKGADTQVQGNWRFISHKYARDTQASHVLPSGRLDLHSDLYRKEAGIDAYAASVQRPSNAGATVNTNNPANTTTDTRLSLSPFLYKQFDSESSLLARLRRTWISTTKNDSNQADDKGTEDEHLLRWERRPARLGYEVEATYNKTPNFPAAQPGSPESNTFYQTRKKITVSPLYALTPELVAGPVVGRDVNHLDGNADQSFNGIISGGQLRWRPNEHMQLISKLTHSVFGKEWLLDFSRKTPWTTLSLTSNREARATANTVTSSSVTPSNLGAVANENTVGRLLFAGRRDNFNLSAGLGRTTPLAEGSGLRTKTYFFETEVIHKLTPLSSLNGSLRWTRGWTFDANNSSALSRDFTARLGLSTKLAPDTTATMGVTRQLTHTQDTTRNPPMRSGAESAAYVGLGHRF